MRVEGIPAALEKAPMKRRKKPCRGFVVWTYTRSDGSRTLGCFRDYQRAKKFAIGKSLTLKNQTAYVDKGSGKSGEPISTFVAGRPGLKV